MDTKTFPLNIPPTDNTAGTPTLVEDYTALTVAIHQLSTNPASFSLQIQMKIATPTYGSDDDDDWIPFQTQPFTSPQIVALADGGVPVTVTHVRVFRNTIGAGNAPKVVLACRDERSV